MQLSKKMTSRSDRVFDVAVTILMVLIFAVVAYPLYFVVIASVSDSALVTTGKIFLLPKGLHLRAYMSVLKNADIITSFLNSVFYTAAGTALNIALTMMSGFALSRKRLVGRTFFLLMISLTMVFSGGIIPTYFVMRGLGLLDTRWIMILPGAVSAYNLIITRTFIQTSIPEELYEAAAIDGCTNFKYFYTIVLPLSTAVIAVLALFYGVAHWNAYFNAMLYIKRRALYPLQLVLREILITSQFTPTDMMDAEDYASVVEMSELMKYALVVISSVPMLVLYPFVQKYFATGVMLGAVKG